ncbi:MAG: DUF5723 family protein [Bacteroidales bacterium]|jgi:hypothetical protein|nr:DUF5723 family protein [Bacteroidales bacterium]MDD3913065.1 DUF5723 family protein [Bacteroidales bacterium]MDD4632980.1 DUF5723 family protein [Bacteroidales bacterium]
MNNYNLKAAGIFFMILFSVTFANAQYNSVLSHTKDNPYGSYYHPAKTNPYKLYIGVPFINFHINYSNSAFHFNDLIYSSNDTTYISPSNFVNAMKAEKNNIRLNTDQELLGLGFKIKKTAVSLSIRQKISCNFEYPKDLFGFLAFGNANYIEEPLLIDNSLKFRANAYHEVAIGIQQQITKHVFIGVRPKMIFGIGSIELTDFYLKVKTDPNGYALTVDEHFNINSSFADLNSLEKCLSGSFFKFFDFYQNYGAAIDLGVYADINKFDFSISALDLGYVLWKGNCKSYSSKIINSGQYYDDGSFFFEGLDILDYYDDGINTGAIVDSLSGYFVVDTTSFDSWASYLTPKISCLAGYDFTPHHRLSLMLLSEINDKNLTIPHISLAYTGTFFNILEVIGAINYDNSQVNLGAGLSVNFMMFRIYAAANNILLFNLKQSQNISCTAGLVFNFLKSK